MKIEHLHDDMNKVWIVNASIKNNQISGKLIFIRERIREPKLVLSGGGSSFLVKLNQNMIGLRRNYASLFLDKLEILEELE